MSTPSLRQRVWNLLRTARMTGRTGIALVTLAAVLGASPETVLGEMLPEMTETPAGFSDPAVYCQPTDEGPFFVPRSFPEI